MPSEVNVEQVAVIKEQYTPDTLRSLANEFARESFGRPLAELAEEQRISFIREVADSMAGELRNGGINETTADEIKEYLVKTLTNS